MPQLDPTPWFALLILTWTTLMLLMTKISNSTTPPSPSSQWEKAHGTTWPWPWY
uniref:ATP synthase complex subunit 8 n=1 Tax=Bipes tridactylus TaxID=273520 RepID=Q66SR8_9SAUR|nr:ATP synthase F0 subunit 8 [Bipes tridactylus]AAT08546.1 ATP synthase F0 subunit 8 [Bipes tridactylus]